VGVHVTSTSYGRPALEALSQLIAAVKADDPMAPVTILVPTNIAGIVARRHLARGVDGRVGVAGLHLTTLPRLAEQLAAPALTAEQRRPATRPVTAAAIRARLDAEPGIFEPVADHPATAQALALASRRLRDVSGRCLTTLESASTLVKDVVRIHRGATADLAEHWYDVTDLLTTATRLVRDQPELTAELGPLVLYLPQDLRRAEAALVQTLAELTDLHVIAGVTGSPRADLAVTATCRALGADLPSPEPESPEPEREPDETGAESPSGTLPARQPLATRVVNASDSDDEVRCVVREVVQALRNHPAHRIAVLYADRSPYARLLHEHLGAASITTNGPGVRPVSERALSRLVLGLLEVARGDYRRGDLFRALGEVGAHDLTGALISVSRWERVSREAGVVGGDHWDQRLATYLEGQDRVIANERAQDEPYEPRIERAEREKQTAAELRAFVTGLQQRFARAASVTTWAELGDWCLDLLHTLVPREDVARMPAEEQYASGVIDRALAALAALDSTGTSPSLATLEEVLTLELESALPRVGRFGEGVLVAPVTSAIGLDLDLVHVVGLSEDLYPGRLHDDSLLPDRVRALTDGELPSIRTRIDLEHRCLLAAFASAGTVVASFPRGDLRRHTHRLPSRWLLPSMRALSGVDTLQATEWQRATGDWLTTSPSFAGSLLATPAPSTEQEWRTRAASARVDLDDQTVDDALAMRRARASTEFTRYDGNLAGQEGLPDLVGGTGSVSPTALERYAICPHEYFVQRMLRVAPSEDPEEQVEISVLDIGNLVHESFDELLTEFEDDLPGYGEPWSDTQRARLQEIGGARADAYEAQGRTGHPLLWARTRTNLLATLDWMLDNDDGWRAAQDARVVASELAFGMRGLPGVDVPVEGGSIAFRGSADKVDQRRDGTLLVTDIKTGSARKFKDLSAANPVAGGEKLQLPVYAHAARARYGAEGTPVEAMYWFVRKDAGTRVQVPLTDEVQQTYAETLTVIANAIARGAFPNRAPDKPDFAWVQCPFCNPDGLGHSDVRRRWEAKRLAPELVDFTGLVEPDAVPEEPSTDASLNDDRGMIR
jgi:RecB family exonuclease